MTKPPRCHVIVLSLAQAAMDQRLGLGRSLGAAARLCNLCSGVSCSMAVRRYVRFVRLRRNRRRQPLPFHYFPFNISAMKAAFALCSAALLVVAPLAYTQDKETEEQLKEAAEAAKKMGVNMPDIQKLLDENAKEDAAEESSAQTTAKTATEKTDIAKSGPSASSAATPAGVTVDLPAGSAKGSLTFDGATAELKFASAFTDQKDDRKPVVLLMTDKKLPTKSGRVNST